ncbi:coiled-coil domain-containing protein 158-like [Patiria miniata]|uniref:Uncharacterized protein n=1 Tax=Patiria miniata TaxID=46514 RepID=A0A913ZYF4_PATMI|nr:coiled-coil domain-containing protein 158-like [Patiria miniata]XP_038056340.1 coiled-coil domain-containing protein 158-like [Patiria miniata]
MSGPSSPTEIVATTTSSYEQQVIIDLQTQLRQLAQQNRESIAKALSATKAAETTSDMSSQANCPKTTHSSTVTTSLPPTTDAASLPSQTLPATSPLGTQPPPIMTDVSADSPDQYSLTSSASSPAKYTSAAPTDPVAVPRVDSHHRIHSAGGLVTTEPFNPQKKDLTTPELPVTNPARKSLLEKQLEDTKTQVFHLDAKLKECNDICEKQKLHFRTAIVDLQTKLNDTIVGRNSVLELRRREAESQEKLVNQLQDTFADVEASNHQQAQVLQDASNRVSILHQELQACNATLTQVMQLTVHHAAHRGLTLSHKTNYSGPMDSELVANTLKEVLEFYEKELDGMRQKIGKAELELTEAREQFTERWRENGEEQKQMLRNLREEQEKQLNAANERAQNARTQTLSLQSQLALTQEQMQKQLEAKTDQITEMQHTLETLRDEAKNAREALQTKCDTLSLDLDTEQKQNKAAAGEKNQLLDQVQQLEQQLHDAKESAEKAEADIEALHEENNRLSSQEEESSIKLNALQSQLERKASECEELGRLVEEVKLESARHEEERVSEVEAKSKHRIVALTDDMTTQLSHITQRCEMLMEDLKQREDELEKTFKSKEDLVRNLAEVQQELQQVTSKKDDAMSDLDKMGQELEATRKEKEKFVNLLEERNLELRSAQSLRDQLQVQVTEKEEQCSRLQEQTSSMTQLAEVTRKANEDWTQERTQMKEVLDKQAKELQDSKLRQESLARKLKIREKRLRSLEEDKRGLEEQAQGTARESETAARSREELKTELRQAKTQVDLKSIEGEKLRASLLEMEQSHQREVRRYQSKMEGLQRELQTAHKTIKATASVDGKAIRVAESMQKQVTAKRSEIDMLQSELHWLNECLDVLRKEKSSLVVERDRYKAQVSELTKNNQNLLKEQEKVKDKRSEQSSVVAKLEESLKKAAKRHAECQTVIGRLEQDVVRLKLKHQLEIKELQRASSRPSPSASIPSKPSSPKDSPTQGTAALTNRANNITANQNRVKLNTANSKDSWHLKRTNMDSKKELASNAATRTREATINNDSRLDEHPRRDLPKSVVHLNPLVASAVVERDRIPSQGKETQTSLLHKNELAKLLTDGELQSLLLEMYGIVSGQPKLSRSTSRSARVVPSPDNPAYSVSTLQEVQETNTKESGYITTPMTRQGKSGMTAPLLTSSPVREDTAPRTQELSLLSSVPAVRDSPRTTPEPDFLLRPQSPVSDLLGVSPHGDQNHHSNNSSNHNTSHQSGSFTMTSFESLQRNRAPEFGLDLSENNTTLQSGLGSSISEGDLDMRVQNDQLKHLQDKLQRLSKMGGHLQKENTDMAIMIKRQDTRLKKCRRQEQSIQQLAKKGR